MSKIGLIGCGVVAEYGHLPAIMNVPDLTLNAVYDPDPKRAEKAAERFHVPRWFSDSDEFFQSDIEAVTITSAAPAHRRNVLDAARYGKHVLCEKPLALTEPEAQEMIAEMQAAKLMLFSAFCYRFSPAALKIKELLEQGKIGKPGSLRLIYDWDCHGKYDRTNTAERVVQLRRENRMLEGGPMIDCGTHQIDLARWWLGSEVARISAAAAWLDEYEAPDHMYAHLDHKNGAHTLVEISYSYGFTARDECSHFVYEIIGSEGIIRYDREQRRFEVRTPDGLEQLPWSDEKNFTGMYAAYAGALKTGRQGYLPSGSDGLAATRIAHEATVQAIAQRFGK